MQLKLQELQPGLRQLTVQPGRFPLHFFLLPKMGDRVGDGGNQKELKRIAIVLIEGGRIIASGTHREFMSTEPKYAEVLARAEQEADASSDGPADDEDDLSYRRRIAASVTAIPSPGAGPGTLGGLGGPAGGVT
jgi:hypothetical protein